MTNSALIPHAAHHRAALLATPIVIVALAISGCGASGGKHFSAAAFPYSFDYPGTWTLARSTASTSGLPSVSLALEEPLDQVSIMQYKLKKTLPAGAEGNRTEVDRIVKTMTRRAGGEASESKAVRYGGLPGFQYVLKYSTGGDVKLSNKVTFLFRGEDEFQFNCQYSPKHSAELNAGCNKILDSLEFN